MSIRTTLITTTLLAVGLISGVAQAALIDRGGGLIYDTDLNVTWLQDANYAKTSGYDADGQMNWSQAVADGQMNWSQATIWAANLSYFDSVRNVTYIDWRLPATTDTSTSSGYNVNPASSEMAHLYFTELGNQSYYTTTGTVSGAYAGGANPNSTLDNVGPFSNFQSSIYWSGTGNGTGTGRAWFFSTFYGHQDQRYDANTPKFYALAVRPGDVAAVPEAETYALMLAGLGLIGWRARRRG